MMEEKLTKFWVSMMQTYQGTTKKIVVVVFNTNSPPLLGRTFLRAFNFNLSINAIHVDSTHSLITGQIKSEYSLVFNGELGAFKHHKISLAIDANAKPVFFKPHPVPFAWKRKIELQLRELIKNDVL